jgi:hypothetical protein
MRLLEHVVRTENRAKEEETGKWMLRITSYHQSMQHTRIFGEMIRERISLSSSQCLLSSTQVIYNTMN